MFGRRHSKRKGAGLICPPTKLIASLDSAPEVEAAWEREADQREAELASGLVATISGTDAIARLRARLQSYPTSFTSS